MVSSRSHIRPLVSSVLLLCAAFSLGARPLSAQQAPAAKELRIFAAADLVPVMPVLAQRYEQTTGVRLKVTTGASGILTTQIENGAPADLFLGADFTFPEKLVADNLTEGKAPTPYARGTLVLFARKDSVLQPLTLDRLGDSRVQKIAIADEAHAPYGRAAVAALTKMGYMEALRSRLVIGENVSQTGQFVVSGNAQLALISLTLASSPTYRQIGTFVLVPASQYPEIRQCAVVLSKGDTTTAHTFLNWLLSAPVQSQLPSLGLRPAQ